MTKYLDLRGEILKINTDWKIILRHISKKDKIEKTFEQLEYKINKFHEKIYFYPQPKDIFRAFKYFDFKDTKVVILGQDPYHQPNQAMGLSFSVSAGIIKPPSLVNIFKELKMDMGIEIPLTGNLENWCRQGVLLLNSSLTVQRDKPNIHNSYWVDFTDEIIKYISENSEKVVFILWGNYAKKKKLLIDEDKHYILEGVHPSPLSASKGWFGCNHFSKTNIYLKENNKKEIDWNLNNI
jgi:uracil-DNA glycosylase